jgi:hypothetical protein
MLEWEGKRTRLIPGKETLVFGKEILIPGKGLCISHGRCLPARMAFMLEVQGAQKTTTQENRYRQKYKMKLI